MKGEELLDVGRVEGPMLQIQEEELNTELEKMKKGKAGGPLEVSMELVKALAKEGEEWVLDLLRKVWEKERIPED